MKRTLPEKLPSTFRELAALFVPHAIANEADYDRTVATMNRLAVLDKRTSGQRPYLDTLALLVEAYDRQRHAIDTSHLPPLELLKSLLKDHGLSASDLGRLLGNRELGSKILRGQRELSKAHILLLSDRFKVSPSLFMQRPPTRYRQAS